MIRNETGIKVYETGDVVTVGNGKVLYRVQMNRTDGTTVIKSENTGKNTAVGTGRLNLVQDYQDMKPGAEEIAKAQEEPVKETSAYAKAVLLALNKLQKHVYAGTVRPNVKAKRRSLNARQKASRKANR